MWDDLAGLTIPHIYPHNAKQASLEKRWRTGEAKCWEEDVPIEHNGNGDNHATGSAPAAAGAAVKGKGKDEKQPKIYIIEPKNKK